MENKSFYFKWLGLKGFRKKYLLKEFPVTYDLSESFEQKIQVYTRNLLLLTLEKKDQGITKEKVEEIKIKCGLEQQQKYVDRIQAILMFLDFIKKEPSPTSQTTSQIFVLQNYQLFKINSLYTNEALLIDENYVDKMHLSFNENILSKQNEWSNEININEFETINVNNGNRL